MHPSAPPLPVNLDGIIPLLPHQQHPSQQQQHSSQQTPQQPQQQPIEEAQLERLVQQGYTRGLATSLNDTKKSFARRIWLVDNSGSMQTTDGHRLVATGRDVHQVSLESCSRWEELHETVVYHIQMAAAMNAFTTFRLLNHPGAAVGPQQWSIGQPQQQDGSGDNNNHVAAALTWIQKTRPGGCTPLTQHILEIHREIVAEEHALRSSGQRVVIVLATDGLPTDERGYGGPLHQEEFMTSLRMLEGLPVWIIVRLCTDEDNVVSFYNELDSQLELSVEVLDDYTSEAAQVHQHNPWLTYGLPLQRMRELGFQERVFDLLDERPMTKHELRDFMAILFGRDFMDGIPDPMLDWDGFEQHIRILNQNESNTLVRSIKPWKLESWFLLLCLKDTDCIDTQIGFCLFDFCPHKNPITKKMEPWINMQKLNRIYGDRSTCEVCRIM